MFEGLHPVGEPDEKWLPAGEVKHPFFVELAFIENHKWPIVGHRPDLMGRFDPPLLFHDPRHDPGDGSYGRFGLAESPDGELRKLTAKEAAAIFDRVPGEFEQAFLCEVFETYLRQLLA